LACAAGRRGRLGQRQACFRPARQISPSLLLLVALGPRPAAEDNVGTRRGWGPRARPLAAEIGRPNSERSSGCSVSSAEASLVRTSGSERGRLRRLPRRGSGPAGSSARRSQPQCPVRAGCPAGVLTQVGPGGVSRAVAGTRHLGELRIRASGVSKGRTGGRGRTTRKDQPGYLVAATLVARMDHVDPGSFALLRSGKMGGTSRGSAMGRHRSQSLPQGAGALFR